MASIGEKIKEVFTGHSHHDQQDASDVKTPDVDAPGAYPSDKSTHKESELSNKPKEASSGHKRSDSGVEIGRPRHDPEIDAKQATSAAGNYPYWGNLPREDERSSAGDTRDQDTNPGLAAPKHGNASVGMAQMDLPDRTRDTMSGANPTSTHNMNNKNVGHDKGEVAAATGASALGAGYLVSHHKHAPEETAEQKTSPGQSGSGGPVRDYSSHAGQPGSTSGPAYTATTASSAQHHDNHKRDGGLAAGAGAAGLGAASYMALKKHDEQFLPEDRPTTTYGSGHANRESTTGLAAAGPVTDCSGNHNTGGVHNTVIGAGSAEHPESHPAPNSSAPMTSPNAAVVGPHSTPATFEQQRYEPKDLGAPTSADGRDRQGLAAAAGVGAGAGVVAAAEHKHHHHHNKHDGKTSNSKEEGRPFANKVVDDDYRDTSTRHGQAHFQPCQPAHAAAAQAWNKQDQPRAGDEDHSKYRSAAAGAAGVGTAGALAAYYGQGKEHEQNPRSEGSEKIAQRALGDDGSARASHNQGQSVGQTGMSSNTVHHSMSGMPPSAATGRWSSAGGHDRDTSSKVVHKCHQCGADNDISGYFEKDATFRMES